jgi:hypothetical protein
LHTVKVDGVFDAKSTQNDIWQTTGEPLISLLLDDTNDTVNGSIMGYGSVGSGQTLTLRGIRDNDHLVGLLDRCYHRLDDAAKAINNTISNNKRSNNTDDDTASASSNDQQNKSSVHLSIVEVYAEHVIDLLREGDTNSSLMKLVSPESPWFPLEMPSKVPPNDTPTYDQWRSYQPHQSWLQMNGGRGWVDVTSSTTTKGTLYQDRLYDADKKRRVMATNMSTSSSRTTVIYWLQLRRPSMKPITLTLVHYSIASQLLLISFQLFFSLYLPSFPIICVGRSC